MKKVLLIEKDPALRKNTREYLESENFRVLTAKDGKEGMKSLRENRPDLILCHYLMPSLDACQLLDNLHLNRKNNSIPFIFFSVQQDQLKLHKGLEEEHLSGLPNGSKKTDLVQAVEDQFLESGKGSRTIPEKTMDSLEDLRNYILQQGESFEIEKNGTIYQEGQHANYIFLLKKGLVKTYKMDEFGKELTTDLFKGNDFFGCYNFKAPSFYPETATTLENSYLFRISTIKFQEILHGSQHLTLELAQLLSDHLSLLKNHLLDMAYGSVLKKTINTILQFTDLKEEEHQEGIRISRTDLASVAGISTESFIRSLSILKKDGLIDIEGRNIRILNQEKLQSIR